MNTITYTQNDFSKQLELLRNNEIDKLDTKGLAEVMAFFITSAWLKIHTHTKNIVQGMIIKDYYRVKHPMVENLKAERRTVKATISALPGLEMMMANIIQTQWALSRLPIAEMFSEIHVTLPDSCPWTINNILPGLPENHNNRVPLFGLLSEQERLLRTGQLDQLNTDDLSRVIELIRRDKLIRF